MNGDLRDDSLHFKFLFAKMWDWWNAWLEKKWNNGIVHAELMLLGFISLLLTVFQPKVASICMSESLSHKMLPCPFEPVAEGPAAEAPAVARRRLFATEATVTNHCKAVTNHLPTPLQIYINILRASPITSPS